MREADGLYFTPTAQVVLPRYPSGRIVLLGDAGHAPGLGGMGTGLALIAAYVLAGELPEADDHPTAFDTHESRIRPFVDVCQRQAKGADIYLVPTKKSRIWRRNQIMRMLPYMPGKA
ncbi:hypothetical protein [Nonomuraea sp. NPDC050643]|uniref:hypothetical protein n=1 Tax=Nonomuraea sp. NPDC050643 TaxID=3155660 RepID=UPI0033F6273B